jgi:hypothetical protein
MINWQRVLENSSEPAVRYLFHTQFLGEESDSASIRTIREEFKNSERVQTMLAESISQHPYQKWRGAHWVLSLLAELGYPTGEDSLVPLRESELSWLLDEERLKRIPLLAGRYRRCASQEGNAVYALVKLGLADERVDRLAQLLLGWQWPDGGWNCDKKPEAHISSFNESLIPLRGLVAYWNVHPDPMVKESIERACEVFLQRHLLRRLTNQHIIRTSFTKLSYPPYWHYDFFFALKVMSEAGKIKDPRLSEALDLLQSKRLPDGGFPTEQKQYRVSEKISTGASPVDWGPVSKIAMNEYVTVQAATVLKLAGRGG